MDPQGRGEPAVGSGTAGGHAGGRRGGDQRSHHPLGGRDSRCWALLSSPPSPRFATLFFFLLKNLPEDSLHSDFSWVCV